MKFEVLIKVGDSNSLHSIENWRDGMPIHYQPEGIYISASEYAKWLIGEIEFPADWSVLRKHQQLAHYRRMLQLRFLINPALTIETLARRIFDLRQSQKPTEKQYRVANAKIKDAKLTVQKIRKQGYDTNWGFNDIKHHSVGIVESETLNAIQDIVDEPFDINEDFLKPRKLVLVRSYRIPYERLISSDSVKEWQDRDKVVVPPRDQDPWNIENLVEDVTLS